MTTTLAVETDTKIADLWGKINVLRSQADNSISRLASLTLTKDNRWLRRTASEVLSQAEALAADPIVAKHLAARQEILNEISEIINTEIKPLEEIFEEHCWSRFFLVVSSQGHIHSSRHCSTCFEMTQYGWLPTISGMTEADAVAQEGSILCSVCFPSAPTEWTTGVSKAQDEKKAAREEKAKLKVEKDAAKAQRKQERVQKCYERALAAIEKFDLDLDADPNLYTPEITKLPSTVFSMLSDLCSERNGREINPRWSDLPLVIR